MKSGKPLTFLQAKRLLRSYGAILEYDRDLNEYRVSWPHKRPEADYYTDDITDAIDTAKVEAEKTQKGSME